MAEPSYPKQRPYWVRAITIAALFGVALFSQYVVNLIQANGEVTGPDFSFALFSNQDFALVVGFWVGCSAFFWAYSAAFAEACPPQAMLKFCLVGAVEAIVLVVVPLLGRIFENRWVDPTRLIIVGFVIISLSAYGLYLIWLRGKSGANNVGPLYTVRHQIFWPVLLGIGVPLYVGVELPKLSGNLLSGNLRWAILPLALVTLLVVGGEWVTKRAAQSGQDTQWRFVLASVLVLVVYVFIAAVVPSSRPFIGTMLYCAVGAAYLASFEAWGWTEDYAQKQEGKLNRSLSAETRCGKWYSAVTVSIIGSSLLIPAVYVYAPFSFGLLGLLVAHSAFSFGLWVSARKGQEPEEQKFQQRKWVTWKIVMGSTALILPFLDHFLPLWFPRFSWSPAPFPVPMTELLFVFLAFLAVPALVTQNEVVTEFRKSGVTGLIKDTSRALGVAFYLALVGVGLSILFYMAAEAAQRDEVAKSLESARRATHACAVYLLYWVLSYIFLMTNTSQKRGGRSGPVATVLALAFLSRLPSSFLIGLSIVVVSVHQGMPLLRSLLVSLPFVLASMGAGAVNDCCDAEKDAINRPYRPIPRGIVSRKFAGYYGFSLLCGSVVLGLSIADSPGTASLYLFAVAGGLVYNPVVARLTVLKNMWTGLLCALPVAFLVYEFGVPLFLPVCVLVYVTGRELLMDVADLQGDVLAGLRTIPARMGPTAASRAAFLVLGVGACVFALGRSSWSLAAVFVIILSVSWWMWTRGSVRARNTVIYMVWFPMLIASLSLAF